MSAVPVTFNGVLYPKNKKDPPVPCVFVGTAWITGLSVGGGPMPGGPDKPVDPPVDLPPPIDKLDEMLTMVAKEPPASGGWGWFPEYGWVYKPSGAGPKR